MLVVYSFPMIPISLRQINMNVERGNVSVQFWLFICIKLSLQPHLGARFTMGPIRPGRLPPVLCWRKRQTKRYTVLRSQRSNLSRFRISKYHTAYTAYAIAKLYILQGKRVLLMRSNVKTGRLYLKNFSFSHIVLLYFNFTQNIISKQLLFYAFNQTKQINLTTPFLSLVNVLVYSVRDKGFRQSVLSLLKSSGTSSSRILKTTFLRVARFHQDFFHKSTPDSQRS